MDSERQRFLDMLTRGMDTPEPEEASQPPAPPPEPDEPALPPETADPPPPALAARFPDDPPAVLEAPLMDLGSEAQAQGTALGLKSIGQRLELIAGGLKAIPLLAGISRDLENLNYAEAAAAVDAVLEWVQGEETALMAAVEARGVARRGEEPPAAPIASVGEPAAPTTWSST